MTYPESYLDQIICGDTQQILKQMPDDCIDTICTSPPYWGLRDYGIKGQIGLEPTLEEYIEKLLVITAELKRVLKPTGVMFWNHGDCYGGSGQGAQTGYGDYKRKNVVGTMKEAVTKSLQPKCLALQNYRLILRMIDEQGWILRNDIKWHKPNHMPSSVKDRFANSYEPVFMLVKQQKYWFDLDVIREPHKQVSKERVLRARSNQHKYSDIQQGINKPKPNTKQKGISNFGRQQNMAISTYQFEQGDYLVTNLHPSGKNPGDVWRIPTQPQKMCHFATFPEKLVEPMIKSSCPQWICKKCGKARVRITKPTEEYAKALGKGWAQGTEVSDKRTNKNYGVLPKGCPRTAQYQTIGWTDCGCNAGWDSGVVLDPFAGASTTAVVARKLGRRYIMIDIKPEYCEMSAKRLSQNYFKF